MDDQRALALALLLDKTQPQCVRGIHDVKLLFGIHGIR